VQHALRIGSYCCTSTKIIIKEIAARIINKTKTKQSKETNKKTRQKTQNHKGTTKQTLDWCYSLSVRNNH
jgi:hypothetical protein